MKEIAGYGLRGEIEFLRKNNNRSVNRQKKIHSIKIKTFHIVFIIFFFILLGYSAFKVGEFMTGWEKLNVKTIKLLNSPKYMTGNVRKALKGYRGNILTLDFEKLRSDLLQIREVSDVSISRKLPSTIEIRFVLRNPVFQFKSRGKYNIIDKDGVILSRKSHSQKDFITIKNIDSEKLKKVVPNLNDLSKIREVIDYISYRDPYGTVLKLKGLNEVFYTGNNIRTDRIRYYFKLKKKLGFSKQKIRRVDLRFKNRFYLEFEEEVI
ncbi:MAG: FtsQ-type POTRA domain-containing protein [Acidobacteriota bacterium]